MATLGELVRWIVLHADRVYRRIAVRVMRRDVLLVGSERRFRALLESAPDAIVIVDWHGHISLVNAQAVRMFGYAREEIIGQPVGILIPEQGRAQHREHQKEYLQDARARPMGSGLALRGRRRDGSQFPVEISLSPLETEGGTLVSAAVRDITERAEHEAEQGALHRIADLVAHGAGADAVFQAVAEAVAQLFGGTIGAVVRFDAATGTGELLGGWSARGEEIAGQSIALDGATAAAEVSRTGRPARRESTWAWPEGPTALDGQAATSTGAVAAPVLVEGHLWGSVGLAFADVPPPAGAEERLARFSDLVAVAIANAEAWDALRRQAATDPLTGLANHRTFHDRLQTEVERAHRYGRDLSLVLFDLDHFKRVNDTFGHQEGDKVLAEVARRLSRDARRGELVARIGGEEFAWLLPETNEEGALAAAERARAAIEREPFGEVGTVSLSAGVCSNEPGREAHDLVRYADRALYLAKAAGRNRTLLYSEQARMRLDEDTRAAARLQTMSSVRALARAIDSKDYSTRRHSERVASLAQRLATELGWDPPRARLLHAAGLLHDVGKIGVPDKILLKPAPLAPEEYEEIKRHAAMGGHIAAEVLEAEQVTWIRGHHERWDGAGYPDGLAGEAIPDGAQVLSLADAWDVMTTARHYQPTKSTDTALAECERECGHQFAPAVVAALLSLAERGDLQAAPGADAFAALQPVFLEQAQPDLAAGGKRRHRREQPIDPDLADDGDRRGVQGVGHVDAGERRPDDDAPIFVDDDPAEPLGALADEASARDRLGRMVDRPHAQPGVEGRLQRVPDRGDLWLGEDDTG
jgi:diguanylate cyclase (GGDEF)-like protein/PAS domain S-box-containing protein